MVLFYCVSVLSFSSVFPWWWFGYLCVKSRNWNLLTVCWFDFPVSGFKEARKSARLTEVRSTCRYSWPWEQLQNKSWSHQWQSRATPLWVHGSMLVTGQTLAASTFEWADNQRHVTTDAGSWFVPDQTLGSCKRLCDKYVLLQRSKVNPAFSQEALMLTGHENSAGEHD